MYGAFVQFRTKHRPVRNFSFLSLSSGFMVIRSGAIWGGSRYRKEGKEGREGRKIIGKIIQEMGSSVDDRPSTNYLNPFVS